MMLRMLDQMTERLFSPFPREFANPTRHPVRSIGDLENYIRSNNGINDCYCSIFTYPFDGMVDKMYFDSDGIGGFNKAMPYAQKFYKHLLKVEHLPTIPVFSGKKGFNLYPLLDPVRMDPLDAKESLKQVAFSMLVRCFGPVRAVTVVDENGKEHPQLETFDPKTGESTNINYTDKNGTNFGLIYFDPKVLGDYRRISRIPNTLRPPNNKSFCTYIDPDKFLTMSPEEIATHCKTQHYYNFDNYYSRKVPSIKHIQLVENLMELISKSNTNITFESIATLPVTDSSRFLKPLLKPCLFKHMLTKEPIHDARVATVAQLKSIKLKNHTIFNAFRGLGWVDFDPEKTMYWIENCSRLRPFGCDTLKSMGLCTEGHACTWFKQQAKIKGIN